MNIEDMRKNTKLLIDGVPYNIVEAEFVKPGKGRAIYRLKLKNLRDNTSLDRTFHSGDKVDEAPIITREKQFLYKEGDRYVFMATDTFEQSFITAEQLGDKKDYLKEGTVVTMLMMDDKPLDVAIPTFVELEVVKTGMSTKTDTVTSQMKSAIMETGAGVDVPTFVKEGDVIKVDTRTGTYVERINIKK